MTGNVLDLGEDVLINFLFYYVLFSFVLSHLNIRLPAESCPVAGM